MPVGNMPGPLGAPPSRRSLVVPRPGTGKMPALPACALVPPPPGGGLDLPEGRSKGRRWGAVLPPSPWERVGVRARPTAPARA